MKYCADTWFLLATFAKDPKAIAIIEETKRGKTFLVIPMVVFAEATKKLLQKGIPMVVINQFFLGVEASEKVELIAPDKVIAREAARLSLTFNISLIDSFVAATAHLSYCNALLSADRDYTPLVKNRYIKVQSW